MSLCGIGIDVTDIGRIERLVATGGDRFVRRWFTSPEVDECRDSRGRTSPHRLAVRFAAKEAAWKALGGDAREGVPWRLIEVRSSRAGGFSVSFSGRLADSHTEKLTLHVSVSTTGTTATAYTIAEREDVGQLRDSSAADRP